ncbi:MAG: HAD hydrolase-like protein [Eubacterium sp.]|jgi:phosphoglycolate phosphatase|nr:HAD hydrolase-like protein [Eubacterium sp.]
MKYNTILFDLDGTLIDPYEGISKTILHVLKTFGDPPLERRSIVKFIGPPLLNGFMEFAGYSREKAMLALKVYRDRYMARGIYETKLTNGVYRLLKVLSRSGVRLGVATLKPDIMTERILNHFDIYKYFEFVSAAELAPEGRNNKTDIIAHALENMNIFGTEREKTLMVGDRHHDIVGADENGIVSVGLLSGYGSRQEFVEFGANYIINKISEVEKIVF